ncbi:MAG TPA: hypothetical protein DCF65_14570 [Chloroflexi bacterium]|nr:hypothetical protein [Chloroflexota bacterium]HAF20922.1 hypothetical protein [Chloroflexota bacterium]
MWLAGVERWFLRAGLFVPLGFACDTFDQYVLPKLLIARVILLGLLILFVIRAALSGALMVKRTPLDLPLVARGLQRHRPPCAGRLVQDEQLRRPAGRRLLVGVHA